LLICFALTAIFAIRICQGCPSLGRRLRNRNQPGGDLLLDVKRFGSNKETVLNSG
jgi:hypothetical protein